MERLKLGDKVRHYASPRNGIILEVLGMVNCGQCIVCKLPTGQTMVYERWQLEKIEETGEVQ